MVLGNVVSNATFFCTYASIQRHFNGDRTEGVQPSTTGTMAAGGVAGALYYLVGHPLDTVQASIMAQRAPKERFSGAIEAVRYLLSQPSGWRTLFRGVLPNVIQAFPGGAVSMVAFEFTLAIITSTTTTTTTTTSTSSVPSTTPVATTSVATPVEKLEAATEKVATSVTAGRAPDYL
jgi:hypothetical protein